MNNYLINLRRALSHLDKARLKAICIVLAKTKKDSASIYLFGNGGSDALASHMACDLSKRAGLRAFSLTANSALVTAIANDLSYSDIFVKQLEIYLDKKDVVIAISASGNSPNIIKAAIFAKKVGCKVIALTGFMTGGTLAKIANIALVVESNNYGVVEDTHLVVNHILTETLSKVKTKDK